MAASAMVGTGNTSVDQTDSYTCGVTESIAWEEGYLPVRKVDAGGLTIQSWCSQH